MVTHTTIPASLARLLASFFAITGIRNHGNEEMNGLSEELLSEVRSEAEYYGISPLVKQLTLCCELNESSCGDVLFYAFLAPPLIPGDPSKYPC